MKTHQPPAITRLHGIIKVFLSHGLHRVEKRVMRLDSKTFKKVNVSMKQTCR